MRRNRPWWRRWLDRLQQRLFPTPVPIRVPAGLPVAQAGRRRATYVAALVGALGLLVAPVAVAQAGEEKVSSGVATGEVVGMNRYQIQLETESKGPVSREIVIPLPRAEAGEKEKEDEVQLSHLRSLADIQEGDVVRVEYRDRYTEEADGTRADFKRRASRITLVRRATSGELRSRE